MGLTGSRQCAVIERCQKKIRDANLSLISTGRLYIVINNYSIYLLL